MAIRKCDSCGWQKRKLYEYKTRFGKEKEICQNCLMYHVFFDNISEFRDQKDLDVFASLNSFYSYKSHQKEQNLFKLLLRYLWSIEEPNITKIKNLWKRHYKSDSIDKYIKRFQKIGILGNVFTDNGDEIAKWGEKINLLIDRFQDAKIRNDIDSWYYNIANIIKSAETLVGISTELDRPTFDKNRYKIMKLFAKSCCDSDGYILSENKKFETLNRGGFECNFTNEKGKRCGKVFDTLEDTFVHLDEHKIPKSEKEKYVKRNKNYVGVWLKTKKIAEQSDKLSYRNWHNIVDRLLKDQDFFIEINANEWLIKANVADAMEKALIKTKELIKEKEKVKEK
ncbi:MAG: hypothetical protein P8Y70_18630 [Candidatus Lokiarchaeota archaeon]